MTHVTCRLTTKNRDQLRNPTLSSRVWASFTFFTVVYVSCVWINIASLFGRFVSIQSRHEMSQTVIPALSSGVTSNTPAPAQISKSNIASHFPFRSLPPPYPPSFPFYPSLSIPPYSITPFPLLPPPPCFQPIPTPSFPPSHCIAAEGLREERYSCPGGSSRQTRFCAIQVG